jgi:glycine cleavage system H protein
MTTKYTEDHEYIRLQGDVGIVGITPHAQDQLGDIVFVELPEIGVRLAKGDVAAVVESVKAASEIYAPASGVVASVNMTLLKDPGLINLSPEDEGWIFTLTLDDTAQLDGLLDAGAYAAHTA